MGLLVFEVVGMIVAMGMLPFVTWRGYDFQSGWAAAGFTLAYGTGTFIAAGASGALAWAIWG